MKRLNRDQAQLFHFFALLLPRANRRGVPTPIGVRNPLLICLRLEGTYFGAYQQPRLDSPSIVALVRLLKISVVT
jgi:hypothetical protein